MSEMEQKIISLESKIKRQQRTLSLLVITVFFMVLGKFSLIGKINWIIDILEKVVYLLDSLIR